MKKKLVCLLLALAMLLALAACSIGGETTEQPAEEEKTSTEQTPAAEETTEEAAETEQPAENACGDLCGLQREDRHHDDHGHVQRRAVPSGDPDPGKVRRGQDHRSDLSGRHL